MTPSATSAPSRPEAFAPFDDGERAALLGGVAEFRRREIAPLVSDPLSRLAPSDLQEVAAAARGFGLLAGDGDTAVALWGRLEDPTSHGFSLASLELLAEADAAVAFHLHQLGLGEALARRFGEQRAGVLAAIHGRHGTAREALARLLARDELPPEGIALLAAHFPVPTEPSPLLVYAGEGWTSLIRPCFDADRQELRWQLHDRQDLLLRQMEDAHGLEGATPWRIVLGPLPRELGSDHGGRLLVQAMAADALASLAIGLGAVRSACHRARRYAIEREQAGVPIHRHPAVGAHLASAAATVALAEAALVGVTTTGVTGFDGLRQVLALRARLHPLLCEAATSALQVHGGYGYLRDYGMERLLRDTQHLKLLGGTPSDLLLFLATHETVPARLEGGRP